MNVLLVSNELCHPGQPNTGGIGAFNSSYMKSLNKKGVTCFYVGLTEQYSGEDYSAERVFFIKPFGYGRSLKKIISKNTYIFLPIFFMLDFLIRLQFTYKVAKLAEALNIDVIESSDYKGISSLLRFFLKNRVPVIIRTHGTNTVLSNLGVQGADYIGKLHERIASNNSQAVIYISESSKVYYEKAFGCANKSKVIFNGVSAPNEVVVNDINDRKLRLCNFGSQSNAKGLGELKKLSTLSDDFEMTLIGKPSKDIIDIDCFKVTYIGAISREALLGKLNDFDCFIFPSKFENCPLSWLEALACGKPILVSDIPVSYEIVQDGENGYICSNTDSYIQGLLKIKSNYVSMCRKAREGYLKKFTEDIMLDSSVEFYKEFL